MYAFPVVMVAGAWTIAHQRRYRPALLALVAFQALVPLVDFLAGKPTLDDPGPSLPISLLLILATIAVLVVGNRGPQEVTVSQAAPWSAGRWLSAHRPRRPGWRSGRAPGGSARPSG
jgi:hypothetical protein